MKKNVRLEDYLNNMGADAFDVVYYDKNNQKMSEEDLQEIDFDNTLVIDSETRKDFERSEEANKDLIIHRVTLDCKIQEKAIYFNQEGLEN